MKQNIILIGGGGHCKSCIDVIEQEGSYQIVGIIDVKEKVGDKILGYPIIGTDNDLEKLSVDCDNFIITLGQIKSDKLRTRLFKRVIELNKNTPTIVSPMAYVSMHSTLGAGTIIMHNAIVNAGSIIGDNCIVNSHSLIEHDVIIGNYNHISTASIINGNVIIGNSCTLGSNSTIINNISVADNVVLGAGSVVTKNIIDEGVYIGIPAKKK